MIHHLLYILQEMETDKNEDEDKKKKGEALLTLWHVHHIHTSDTSEEKVDSSSFVLQLQSAASSRATRRSRCFWSR